MILLNTHWYQYALIVFIFLIFVVLFVFGLTILKTLISKNNKMKVLKISREKDAAASYYANRLYELIAIKTTSYETGEAYHQFREKVKAFFPLMHQYFVKEKLGGNAVFTYKSENVNAKKVLLVTHMDTTNFDVQEYMTDTEVFGSGAFDSKALLFTICQSVEEYLQLHKKFDIDLTVVMTVDDNTTKEGNDRVVDMFLKRGNFFHLVIEEGIGIIDPTFLGMKSNYALVGIGVTGEVKIRYKARNDIKGKEKLENFIKDIQKENIFKSKIDHDAVNVLNELSKDMPFSNRLLFGNIWLYRPFVKNIIDTDQTELSKLLKTHIKCSSIYSYENHFCVDIIYELATHDTTVDVLRTTESLVQKYNLVHEILSYIDASKITSLQQEGYQTVKKAILETYKNLYVAPYIITKISEQRQFTKVSDCVVRFSPLYYPYQALTDAKNGNEHIMKKSLCYGIDFYKNIFDTYSTKEKPHVL